MLMAWLAGGGGDDDDDAKKPEEIPPILVWLIFHCWVLTYARVIINLFLYSRIFFIDLLVSEKTITRGGYRPAGEERRDENCVEINYNRTINNNKMYYQKGC